MKNNELTIPVLDFKGGVNKLIDEGLLPLNQAKEAINLMQTQQANYKPRYGTAYYGSDLAANPDGATEYVVSKTQRELIAVANGKFYYSTDDGVTWNEQTGATYTAGTQCYFLQISSYLYVANGTDTLSRYTSNGVTRSLTTYTALSAPTGLSGTASSISGSGYTYWAQVTALNSIGETVGSSEASCPVNKNRDFWISASDSINWSWSAVSGAVRYQLYISDTQGYEGLLTSIASDITSYRDRGTETINPYVTPPLSNSTGAPKFKDMALSGNRIWATNDTNEPYKVHFSGTGINIGIFSDFFGGGWINLERGGREFPTKVVHYLSGQGAGTATVLCSTPEGKGAVWQIGLESATVGSTSFTVPSASKVVGSSGTDAQLSVVQTTNDIMFFNRKGIFSLGPEKNFYGILRTNELTSNIRPYIRSLVGSQISKVCAIFYDAKVIISVPTSATGNNRMIVYDTERLNWIADWSIGCKQFLEYTDTSGNSKLLYVPISGTKLIEMSESIAGDLGVAFPTSYTSGRWQVAKYFKDFSKVNKVFIRLSSPRGTINFDVSGTRKNKPFSALAATTITPQYSLTGMGWDEMGSVQMGSTSGVPTFFSDTSDIRYVKIRKKIRDIQFRVSSNNVETNYTLLGFLVEGKLTRTRPPSTWKV